VIKYIKSCKDIIFGGIRLKEDKLHENTSGLENETKNEVNLTLVCTLSGRIIYATKELKIVFGTELSGKNLNDFLDDKLVSKIIYNSANSDCFYFDCVVSGKVYSGFSEKEGNAINISLSKKANSESSIISDNSLKYLQAELNAGLSLLLGALQSFSNKDDPNATFAKHNVYKLVRATRNVFDSINCESGEDIYLIQNYDILEICQNVVENLRFPLRCINTEIEIWHDEGRHICYCVAEHIQRILTNLLSCALKGLSDEKKSTCVRIEILEKENDILIAVTTPHKIIIDKFISSIISQHDNKNDISDGEMKQTLKTIKALVAYNKGNIMVTTGKDRDRLAIILPKSPDSDKTILRSPSVRYETGTSLALMELSEILPDSLY
jgi:hypothetical protein